MKDNCNFDYYRQDLSSEVRWKITLEEALNVLIPNYPHLTESEIIDMLHSNPHKKIVHSVSALYWAEKRVIKEINAESGILPESLFENEDFRNCKVLLKIKTRRENRHFLNLDIILNELSRAGALEGSRVKVDYFSEKITA
jgi:hypothetical protein